MKFERIEWCSPEYQQALELRHRVLREPLGLSFTGDDLDAEHADAHFVAVEGESILGVLVASPADGSTIKLRQMAVDAGHRRQGIGTKLIQFVEAEMKSKGIQSATLHAREEAVAFYERLGYAIEGDPFEEVGILHQQMQKSI